MIDGIPADWWMKLFAGIVWLARIVLAALACTFLWWALSWLGRALVVVIALFAVCLLPPDSNDDDWFP